MALLQHGDHAKYRKLSEKTEPLTPEEQAWVSDYLYREKLDWESEQLGDWYYGISEEYEEDTDDC